MNLFAWLRRERQWRSDHIAAFSAVAQKDGSGLTLFQNQALSALAHLVPAERFKRAPMDKGDGEYVLAPLGSGGAELYIYPNEAAIFGRKPYAWFEEWDYRTPEDLLQALVKECASRIAEHSHSGSTTLQQPAVNGAGALKYYLQGLSCIIVLFAIVIAVGNLAVFLSAPGALDTLIPLSLGFGLIALGYVYKRWKGPLIFSADGGAVARLLPFVLGVGTLLGPMTIFGSGVFADGTAVQQLIWLLVSVPLTSVPVFVSMLIGSALYRVQCQGR